MDISVDYKFYNEINNKKITNYNISKISEGIIIIMDSHSYGFINIEKNVTINPKYEYISDFNNGIAVFKSNMLYGLINKYGDIIIPPTYYHIAYIHSGYYKASPYMGKIDYHIIDTTGKILYEGTNLDYIIYNDNSIIMKEMYRTKKLCDKNFNPISKNYLNIDKPTNGLLKVRSLKKSNSNKLGDIYGIIDEEGNELIKPKYKSISIIDNNRLMVIDKKDRVRIINLEEKTLKKININYSEIGIFENDKAICSLNDKDGIIDSNGLTIVDNTYDWIGRLSDGNYRVFLNGKYGIIDSNGNLITDILYDSIGLFKNGNYCLRIGNKIIVTTNTGKIIFNIEDYNMTETSFGYKLEKYTSPLRNEIILINSSGIELSRKKSVVSCDILDNYVIWNYLDGKELTDIYGNNIIPQINCDMCFLDNKRVIVNNTIINLNNEYFDLNIIYKLEIKYNNKTFIESFKSEEERMTYKEYFQERVVNKIKQLSEETKKAIQKLDENLKNESLELLNNSMENFQKSKLKK